MSDQTHMLQFISANMTNLNIPAVFLALLGLATSR